MMRALLKKQLLELNTFYFQDRRTGKIRSKAGIIGYIVLFLFVFFSIALSFFGVAVLFADAMIPAGLDWLYFALMGMMAIVLGVFGSVFNTYAGLYNARDNELLLSMPITPARILFVRMLGVYLMSLLYSAIAWLPTVAVYHMEAEPTAASSVMSVLLTFVITAVVTVLTCALGGVVARIASRTKNKSFVTVVLTLAFLGVYYFVCFRLNTLLQMLLMNTDRIGSAVKTWLYPLYMLGLAAKGEILPMLIFTAIAAGLSALCVLILSRSFIRNITTNRGSRKAVYKRKKARASSADRAMLRKELKRFTSSPTYLLNCGLGLVIIPAVAVFALLRADEMQSVINILAQMMPVVQKDMPVIMAAAVCLIVSMNAISAPSVSLEGKNLWVLQSLPVKPQRALMAKIKLHVILNLIPAAAGTVLLGISVRAGAGTIVCMNVLVLTYIWFTALFGLTMDLKRPNLTWTNEAVPVKQSLSIFIALFGGWLVSLTIGGGCLMLPMLEPWLYMLIVSAVLCGLGILLNRWIKNKGADIFANL